MDNKATERLAVEMKREYCRNWQRANKDKVKTYQRNYWQRKAEKAISERGRNNNDKRKG